MAWKIVGQAHYAGNPSASTKDAVRWRVGDTDPGDWLTSDAEISYALTLESASVLLASIRVCEHLAGRFSREKDESTSNPGGVSISRSSVRAKAFSDRAKELRAEAIRSGELSSIVSASGFAGGISQADKDDLAADTDNITPAFRQGMFESV